MNKDELIKELNRHNRKDLTQWASDQAELIMAHVDSINAQAYVKYAQSLDDEVNAILEKPIARMALDRFIKDFTKKVEASKEITSQGCQNFCYITLDEIRDEFRLLEKIFETDLDKKD